MKDIPEGFIRRKTSTIPFGYKLADDVKGYLEPIQVEIESLQLIEQMIVGEEISFKYYDASEDVVLLIDETYEFVANEELGDIMSDDAELYNIVYPHEFQFNLSNLVSYYYFSSVTINGAQVDAEDWVGAFKGDECVGSRQWNTSSCGGYVCDLPVMGSDGTTQTVGYMYPGDVPTFKVYDYSENEYFDGLPSENYGFYNTGLFNISRLDAVYYQNLNLHGGANLMSFHVLPDDADLEDVFIVPIFGYLQMYMWVIL